MAKAVDTLVIRVVEQTAGGSRVALSGNITEFANFTTVRSLPGPLHIDLSGIEKINSLGVRTWIEFVRSCESAGLAMTFERCSPLMVQQLGMISNFMGRQSVVKSLIVPYLCPSCNGEAEQLVELSKQGPFQIPPSMACPKCRSAMQVDELEDMYASLAQNLASR